MAEIFGGENGGEVRAGEVLLKDSGYGDLHAHSTKCSIINGFGTRKGVFALANTRNNPKLSHVKNVM